MRRAFALLFALLASPALGMVTDTGLQTKGPVPGAHVELFSGTVDQTAIDSAVSACEGSGTDCLYVLDAGAVVTGRLVIDGDMGANNVTLTVKVGAVPGTVTEPIWQYPILSEVAGTGANNCSSGFNCQDEDHSAMICVSDSNESNGSDGCSGAGTGTFSGEVNILGPMTLDGRMDEQPAPRPEGCVDGSPACVLRWPQRGIEIEAGTVGIIEEVTGRSFNNFFLLVQGVAGGEVRLADIDDMGCNPSSSWSPCGADWASVPGAGSLARQTDGFGINLQENADNWWIHDSTFGTKITKHAVEVFFADGGSEGCSDANAPQDVVIEDNTSGSPIGSNGGCRPIIQDNVITGVRKPGEEASEVGWGVFLGTGNEGARILRNTITDVQRHGIHASAPSEEDIEIIDNVVTDPCQTETGGNCSGINFATGLATTTDLHIYRNLLDVVDAEHGIRVDGVDGGSLALNVVKGGDGTALESALLLEDVDGIDCRYNILEWDTDVGDAITIDGGGTTALVLQADCFGEAIQYEYTGAGGSARIAELNTPTAYRDCDADTTLSGCYDTYSLAIMGDTQASGTYSGSPGYPGYLEDSVLWVIDSRDAFQMERTVGEAAYPGEAYNFLMIVGVGDIVSLSSDTTGLAAQRNAYDQARTSTIAPIIWVAPPGNHDCVVSGSWNCTNYISAFGSSTYYTGRAVFRESTGLTQSRYASPNFLSMAFRYKALDRWEQMLTMPWGVEGIAAYQGQLQSYIDEYPNDIARLSVHHMALVGLDASNEDCGDITGHSMWANVFNDTGHANYDRWVASMQGHSTALNGWICRAKEAQTAGTDFLVTGVNYQNSGNYFGKGAGEGWVLIQQQDVGAETVRLRVFSPLADSGAGGYAETYEPSLGVGELRDRTESIDFATR